MALNPNQLLCLTLRGLPGAFREHSSTIIWPFRADSWPGMPKECSKNAPGMPPGASGGSKIIGAQIPASVAFASHKARARQRTTWDPGGLLIWLQLMWLQFEVVRGPVGVVWGRFGTLPRPALTSNAVTREFTKPHDMALELVYRAENLCKSSGAPAGAFPRQPRCRVGPGSNPKSMIFGPPLPCPKILGTSKT